jgi:hypothetical protein
MLRGKPLANWNGLVLPKIREQLDAKCRMVLSYDTYNETVADRQEKDEEIQTLVKKQEKFEQLIQSLIDSGQLKPVNNQLPGNNFLDNS